MEFKVGDRVRVIKELHHQSWRVDQYLDRESVVREISPGAFGYGPTVILTDIRCGKSEDIPIWFLPWELQHLKPIAPAPEGSDE